MPPFSSKIGRAKADDKFSINLAFAPYSAHEIFKERANIKILKKQVTLKNRVRQDILYSFSVLLLV